MTRPHAVPLGRRSGLILTVASVAGLMMLIWPLLVRSPAGGQVGPPFIFLALLPVVIMVVLAEVTEGGLDPRVLAVLGVLSAVNAVLRGISPGTGGFELVFFLLILAGRVFGPGFGFVLGCTSLFASALLTGGVGPWLPFQMMCSAWVGMGAGLLPRRVTGRSEIAMLAAYGVVTAYAFGLLLNLSSWPFVLGIAVPGHTGLAFVPGDPMVGQPASLPDLHADHLDRLVRHRSRDHQRAGDHAARAGRPDHPAARRPPGGDRRDRRKAVVCHVGHP